MRKDKVNNKVGLGVGYVSALLIFAVLCLVIFAVMSYRAAASTDSFNDRSGSFLKQYYEADGKAKEITAKLHGYAVEAAESGFFEEEFEESAAGVEGVSVSRIQQGISTRFTVRINDKQDIRVTLLFNSNGGYTVEQWQSVNKNEENSDEHIGVWDGSELFR